MHPLSISKHIKKISLLFILIIIIGILGYMVIEGWSFTDSLYMTLMTISTVGFNEVHPLSPAGRFYTNFVIVIGVGAFLYTMSIFAEYIIAGHLHGALERRRMKKKIDALRGHHIICGFGRVGYEVAQELHKDNVEFVVIDSSPEAVKHCSDLNYRIIEGNASKDDVLREAGIMEAKGLVTATDSDADNVYVTLSAKSLNNELLVVARATNDEAEHKLLKAGADRVISPYRLGGHRLASLLTRPTVVEFMDVIMQKTDIEFIMEDIHIRENSSFADKTMVEARAMCVAGLNILALKKGVKGIITSPSPETLIEQGDNMVVIGTREQLKALEDIS